MEKLDLVSICCRATVDHSPDHPYLCLSCHMPCEAVRPDRGAPYDPDRKEWVRKTPGIATDAVSKAAKDSRDMSTWPRIKVEQRPAVPLHGFTEFRKEHGKDLLT